MQLAKALIFSLALAASAVVPAMAQDAASGWEAYGGLTRHSINATVHVDGDEVSESSGADVGWQGGGRYWLSPNFAVGVMIDSVGSTMKTTMNYLDLSAESTSAVTGILATADYLAAAGENWRGLLQVGVGSYTPKAKFKIGDSLGNETEIEVEGKSTLGFLIGGQLNAGITERLSLDATISYRWLSTEVEDVNVDGTAVPVGDMEYDVNSWAAGIGFTYRF